MTEFRRIEIKKIIRVEIKECWLHKKLPIYWKFYKLWFCAWSTPDIKNRSWKETLKALRITIRKGKFHSEIVKVIKIGYT